MVSILSIMIVVDISWQKGTFEPGIVYLSAYPLFGNYVEASEYKSLYLMSINNEPQLIYNRPHQFGLF